MFGIRKKAKLPKVKFSKLADNIRASRDKLQEVIEHLDTRQLEDGTRVDFHYVKFDDNGAPDVRTFLHRLYTLIKWWALDNQRILATWNDDDAQQLLELEARKSFRHLEKTGELGELLVFALTEAFLEAPQALAKMQRKMERRKEADGADAIHARWDASTKSLVLYWGEAKIEQTPSKAAQNAFKSLHDLFANGNDHEDLVLLRTEPSQLYPRLEEHLQAWYERRHKFPVREEAVIFLGYEEKSLAHISKLHYQEREKAFLKAFRDSLDRRVQNISTHRPSFTSKSMTGITVFFLPFKDVEDLRSKFQALIESRAVSSE